MSRIWLGRSTDFFDGAEEHLRVLSRGGSLDFVCLPLLVLQVFHDARVILVEPVLMRSFAGADTGFF